MSSDWVTNIERIGNNKVGNGRFIPNYHPDIRVELRINHVNLIQDSRCPGGDSNWVPPECKSKAFPPVILLNICDLIFY